MLKNVNTVRLGGWSRRVVFTLAYLLILGVCLLVLSRSLNLFL